MSYHECDKINNSQNKQKPAPYLVYLGPFNIRTMRSFSHFRSVTWRWENLRPSRLQAPFLPASSYVSWGPYPHPRSILKHEAM